MPYIVKSSLDIGGKIIPWNEREAETLIKEKEQFFKEKEEFVFNTKAEKVEKVEEPKQEKQEKQESLKKTEAKVKKGKE